MSNEFMTGKLAELKAEAEELCKVYNEAIMDNRLSEAAKIDESIDSKIEDYTGIVQKMCFNECRDSENPMLTAVTRLTYTTIKKKDTKDKDLEISIRSIIDNEVQIDLFKLHKYCGGIGADTRWLYILQKMNFLISVQTVEEFDQDSKRIRDNYKMKDIAREFNFAENANFKSNSSMLKCLQTLVSAMLGEGYKPISHDVKWLMMVYHNKGKGAMDVVCADHKRFCKYVAAVCHHIVTGEQYNIIVKELKKA